jgi:hypothetical protein
MFNKNILAVNSVTDIAFMITVAIIKGVLTFVQIQYILRNIVIFGGSGV